MRQDRQRKRSTTLQDEKLAEFERLILPQIDAAYNLARWIMRDESLAQDAVQEAYLRAFAAFDSFRGNDGRAWMLSIVRNTCYTLLRKQQPLQSADLLDEMVHPAPAYGSDPELLYLRSVDRAALLRALDRLPAEFREVLVLREFEDMSYREIAQTTELPIGTVMSRLARARQRLQSILAAPQKAGVV